MAKGTSFADKSKGTKKKGLSFVKYIKSNKSEKTGHWRFNEQMVSLNSGENLDGALKRMEEETLALDMELPTPFDEAVEENVKEESQTEAEASDDSVEKVTDVEDLRLEKAEEQSNDESEEDIETTANVEESKKTEEPASDAITEDATVEEDIA